MPRYLVTTRRGERETTISAAEAVKGQPGITPLRTDDPHMVTVEASEEGANLLRARLRNTHFVEPEVRRSLE